MSKTAFLFPGQGAQYVGMGKDLYNHCQSARNVFETADKILGKKITEMCFSGDEALLKQTVNTQPCLVTTSIATLEALKSRISSLKPDFVAGHSLGEYCAMHCADVLTLEQTLLAIQKRAGLMASVQKGSMSAVMKATDEQIQNALKKGLEQGYIDIANYNSPQQIVLTGDNNAMQIANEYLSSLEGVRVVPLAISGAFHSKYLEPVSKDLANYIKDFKMNNAKIPVITNVDAKETVLAEEFRKKIPEQMISSVHWTQTIQKMLQNGVDKFVEIGPGKVLTGLVKRIAPKETKLYNVFDMQSLDDTVKSLADYCI